MLDRLYAAYEKAALPQALLFLQPLPQDLHAIQDFIKKMMGKIPHPDYIVFNQASIKVDDIRLLQEKLMLTPYCAKHYVVFFEKLETLNVPAMNALLKILEEPSARVYFFATTHRVDLILPTVLSRFQKWICPQGKHAVEMRWDVSLVSGWLHYMQGNISSYQLTEQWLKYPLQALGEQLYCIVAEMIRLSLTDASTSDDALLTLNQLIPMTRKYSLLEKLTLTLRQLQAGIPLQGALLIETWVSWEEYVRD